MEKGSEIRDCNFERDTGISDFTKRDSGNDTFFSGKVGRKCRKRIKLYVNVGNSGAKSCSTFSTTLGPITDLSRDYRKRLRSLISSPDVPSLR